MKYRCALCLTPVFIVLGFFSEGLAVVEWNVIKTFQLEKPPLDVAVSGNGRWVFVLNEGGRVLIYSAEGTLKDSMVVGSHVEGIAAGPREDTLFLTSRKGGTIQEVLLDFIQEIDTAGAPFKGPKGAPVVIAVFSDYQ